LFFGKPLAAAASMKASHNGWCPLMWATFSGPPLPRLASASPSKCSDFLK
jgi:hypothetical protein